MHTDKFCGTPCSQASCLKTLLSYLFKPTFPLSGRPSNVFKLLIRCGGVESSFKDKQQLKLGFYVVYVYKHWAIVHRACFSRFFSLTFFPPCFSTMSVLSGKWSSWGVLDPPPLGIVQLSPRQASFTLPFHRHQPSERTSDGGLATGYDISLETHLHTASRCSH